MNLKAAILLVSMIALAGSSYWGGWRLRGMMADTQEAQQEAQRATDHAQQLAAARAREQEATTNAASNQAALRADLRRVLERLRDYRNDAGPAGVPQASADRPDAAGADPLTDVLAGAPAADADREADAVLAGVTAAKLAACVRQLQADRLTVNGTP